MKKICPESFFARQVEFSWSIEYNHAKLYFWFEISLVIFIKQGKNIRLSGSFYISMIYYNADTPVTRLRLLTDVSHNIAVPYASLRSLILLFYPTGLTFIRSARGMLDSVSHNKIWSTYNIPWGLRWYKLTRVCPIMVIFKICDLQVKNFRMVYHRQVYLKILQSLHV